MTTSILPVPPDGPEPLMQPRCRIALFGECMIELRGQMFGPMQQYFGGDTLNTAVYLARLVKDSGIEVAYATQLGNDAYSQGMLQAWQQEGLDISLVARAAGRMPGLYTIQVDEHGERTFYYWRDSSAAKQYFEAAASPLEDQLDHIDALYFSGISLAVLDPADVPRRAGHPEVPGDEPAVGCADANPPLHDLPFGQVSRAAGRAAAAAVKTPRRPEGPSSLGPGRVQRPGRGALSRPAWRACPGSSCCGWLRHVPG